MNVQHKCDVCGNYTDVYVEVGYIRMNDDGNYFVIPEDRMAVWNDIMERLDEAPTYQASQPIMEEQWQEFKDCHIDRGNVENYRVMIE